MVYVIVILVLVGIGLAILAAKQRNEIAEGVTRGDLLASKVAAASGEIAIKTSELAVARSQLEALAKYQLIVDVENEVRRIKVESEQFRQREERQCADLLTAARTEAEQLREHARLELAAAAQSSREIKAVASAKAQELQAQAERTMAGAAAEAVRITDQAHKRAEEIAGDAYNALRNVDELKRTATAMRNIIDGYGDSYLVPARSLLDELAEDFGHTEAGERLRMAREASKAMIKSGQAASCDYAEANRRAIAINFVIDAYNGKVDSVLSRTKQDNYGKLEQEIRDAFTLVNAHGEAFRNARITETYLTSRLEELKWATIAMEIKDREKEEQRAIKERIREEERARKEFERAIKEAEREEEVVKKAIEKARKEIEAADGEKRAMYEAKLADLTQRLKDAEEKNQRALSMAQQTRMGNVYVISNVGSFGENIYKIGMTRRLEPLDRVRELGDASVPFEFDVHAMIPSQDAPKLEHDLHQRFLRSQVNKVNPRKEFFRLSIADIKATVEAMDIEAKWTMSAEAADYRETLALEKRLAEDAEAAKTWERQQEKAVDAIAIQEARDPIDADA
jgi:hypothetical protein